MSKSLTIAIDAMGGDHAPDAVIGGIEHVLKENSGVRFILFGPRDKLEPLVQAGPNIEIVHTEDFVAMDAKPTQALRKREKTSMWHAIKAVKDGRADAVVSAGNTGALMAMSYFCLGTADGISRPAISALWPTLNGPSIVLDVGANIDTTVEQLIEFAAMGSACARVLFNKERPTVGLLNVGSEDVKGHSSVREAAAVLREDKFKFGLNYTGFVEGNGIPFGAADVIVTDGFTGNVALKTAEGMAKMMARELRNAFKKNALTMIGALVAKQAFDHLRKKFDPNQANGAPLLGLNGLVIKSHGGTDEAGFANAISTAMRLANGDFTNRIISSLQSVKEWEQTLHDGEEQSTDPEATTQTEQSLAVSS